MSVTAIRPASSVRSLEPIIWLSGISLLLFVELFNHASFEFASLMGLFSLITWFAYSAAGGFRTVYGLGILAMAIEHIWASQFGALWFHTPPEKHLSVPIATMSMYCVGMASIGVGVWIGTRLPLLIGKRPLFGPIPDDAYTLRNMAIAGTLFAFFRLALMMTSKGATGGIIGPIKFLISDDFVIACGTAATVVGSKGRRSLGILNITPMLPYFALSFVGASRGGMIALLVTYVVTALAYGYRFKPQHVVTVIIFALILEKIIFPWAAVARNYVRGESGAISQTSKGLSLLVEACSPESFREKYLHIPNTDPPAVVAARTYYDGTAGETLGRATLIKPVDVVMECVLRQEPWGMKTITSGFWKSIPSFLNADKSQGGDGTSNMLAHRSSVLMDPKDVTTQPTFGLLLDSFSAYLWWGVAIIPGLLVGFSAYVYRHIMDIKLLGNVFALGWLFQLSLHFSEWPIADWIEVSLFYAPIMLLSFIMLRSFTSLLDSSYLRRLNIRRRPMAQQ